MPHLDHDGDVWLLNLGSGENRFNPAMLAGLSCAHDQAVMRADRGYWCLPEVDLGLPFTHGMDGLVRSRLPIRTSHEAMTTGRKYRGAAAAAAGPSLGGIKARIYATVVTGLREPPGDPFAMAAGAPADA